jgi:restriction system protein
MRRSHRRLGLFPVALLAAIAYTYWNYAKYVVVVAALVFVIKLLIKFIRRFRIAVHNIRLRDVDTMDGISFERYVAQLLIDRGYENVSLTEQYDYGVDIIAEKDDVRWGVQVKRHSGLVKAAAVRQVVTGLRLYSCDRAMVITNSTFSAVAKRLAESNDCVLIDRSGLYELAR